MFLKFIYTGHLETESTSLENLVELIALADRYEVMFRGTRYKHRIGLSTDSSHVFSCKRCPSSIRHSATVLKIRTISIIRQWRKTFHIFVQTAQPKLRNLEQVC